MSFLDRPRGRIFAHSCRLTRRTLLASATLAMLGGTMPGPLLAQASPKKGGILKIAAPFNPSSLDPLTGGAGSDHMLLYPLFDTLVDFEPATLAPKPGLATSWEFTDPKTLVLTLREGVRFHDGEPFDAAAVKAHLDRAREDPRSAVKGDIASLERVEVLAPNKVALHLSRPDAALPLILADRAGMVSSPKAVAAKGRQYDREPVGTGPFKLEKWNDNDVVTMVRNPDYWNKELPHLDGLTFRIITDLNTGLRSVIAGENHFAYRLNPQQKVVADRAGAGKVVVASNPTIADYHLVFNYRRAPLNNVKVRQAINYAIDREAFNKAALLGLGVPAQTMLPPGYWAHDPALDNYYTHDPEKARALLKEAGFPDGIDLTFFGNSDQASQQRHEIIMEQLRKAGIRPDTLRHAAAEADALIVRVRLPDDIFDHAPRLQACIRHGVGLDFIPVEAATRAGIVVGNLPDANTQAVVEHAAGCALVLAKDFQALADDFRANGWATRDRHPSLELAGRTLGIVGCGRIGRGVARAMKQAFGMRVIGYNRSAMMPDAGIEPATLDEVFGQADIIVLTIALAPETRGLVNAGRLASMKPGALLINVARGELIDDAALIAALETGHLGGAALDVFDHEPLPPDHVLLSAPRLFLTPHIAGGTRESLRRMSMEAAQDALAVLQGKPPSHLINPEVWPAHIDRVSGAAGC